MPTLTSIIQLKNTNKAILFPLIIKGKLKYKTLNSIANDSNIKITEKYVANLCIQNRLFFFQKLKINTLK